LTASAQSETKTPSFPVTGTGTAASGPVAFEGTFNVQRFELVDGRLVAIGHLSGTVTTVDGTKVDVPDGEVTLPVLSINDKALPTGMAAAAPVTNLDAGAADDGSVAMLQIAQAATATPTLTPTATATPTPLLSLLNTPTPTPTTTAGTTTGCNILHLVLGPLHLNLLGLVVDLNQVILNVTGQTGAGNVLGNLLCAIAGIPVSTPPTPGTPALLTNLLNAVLAVLGLGLP
jgi:hypothetical protein